MNVSKYTVSRGFTLIEILVVLLIIGTLSAVVFANFSDARVSAKNKALKSDLKELQLSLELYKSQNGNYPDIGVCGSTSSGVSMARSLDAACSTINIIAGLSPDFIDKLPTHRGAANASCDIIYQVESGARSWYKLTAANCFGGATNALSGVSVDDDLARCPTSCPASGTCNPSTTDFYESYAIYSAGGQCE